MCARTRAFISLASFLFIFYFVVGVRYALFFLVRSAPEEMLCLQNGRFDDPDRSFTSIKSAWDSVLRNHADLKVRVVVKVRFLVSKRRPSEGRGLFFRASTKRAKILYFFRDFFVPAYWGWYFFFLTWTFFWVFFFFCLLQDTQDTQWLIGCSLVPANVFTKVLSTELQRQGGDGCFVCQVWYALGQQSQHVVLYQRVYWTGTRPTWVIWRRVLRSL